MRNRRGAVSVHIVDHDERASVIQVRGLERDVELFVRTSGTLDDSATMWLPLVLPVAMRAAKPLHIHGAVDEVALAGSRRAQEVLAAWWPRWLTVVDVTADSVTSADHDPPSDGVGLAFSAGVDAFHSLHRHRQEVTHLWFVHGFDVPLWRTDLRADIARRLAVIAEQTGTELVEVVTNVKPWADHTTRWGEVYCGPATAGIALGHAPMWRRSLIASSGDGEVIPEWSTHPDLDPFWSSRRVHVVHDAADIGRVDKVRQIADWTIAMEHLRVCWANPNQEYNCGTCEKCLRTIVNFIAADAAGRCSTLPAEPALPLPPIIGPDYWNPWAQSLASLRTITDRRPDLEAAIVDARRRGPQAGRRTKVRSAIERVGRPVKTLLER